jgi:glutamine---fructose-6-phosphate transaminase (isomerizing)
MCGIFGVVSKTAINGDELSLLAQHSEQRGKDSSGLFMSNANGYDLHRANQAITTLLKHVHIPTTGFVMGHSRLITNGLADNQPIYRDGVCVIHNGIVLNHDTLWTALSKRRHQEIDTEVIAAIAADHLEQGGSVDGIAARVLGLCEGVVACAIALPKLGKLCLFSNNGSLYHGTKNGVHYFASEGYPLTQLKCEAVVQVRHEGLLLEIPPAAAEPVVAEHAQRTTNIIPNLGQHNAEEAMLEYKPYTLRRCTRCILPHTMPYIRFDDAGVCNYCHNYRLRNRPKPVEQLLELVAPFRRTNGDDCIVPFSGGRAAAMAYT